MNTYLDKLEFNKILENLEKYCITLQGKHLALSLTPSNVANTVQNLLSETEEAVNLSYRNSMPSFYEINPIDVELKKLESGISLSCKELLNLNKIFKNSHILKEYFNKDFLDLNDYPILSTLFEKLYFNKSIMDKIEACILDENLIDDKASSTLQNIRKKKRNLELDIREKLNSMVHSSSYSKYIQENIITIRNERFVIPVKEEYRSQIKGFIHDISNAGSTVFIEPIAVFEMNNDLSKLKIEEEIEIEKILQELSFLFEPYIEELKSSLDLIGKLDFIFAKAKYSKEIKGITPKINSKKEINLVNARHPLIAKEKAVPISVNLGSDFSTLLITGPNTGGKTVTLKTVGLLCSMACSGLNIPADEKSSIYVFSNIFSDIGDDQSISDSLSTFSSHMINLVEILKNVTENSLVLVDELGSGTDPIEGANLAIAILAHLKNVGALTIATTHYQELKQYALVTDGFENASVEFDVATLTPTYKLLVGIPGKSNAFEISKNLGLDESIINKAKSLMTSNQVNIEELLKNIYDNKAEVEKEKAEIDSKLANIANLENKLENDYETLKNKEQELISNAKIKARNILLDAKEEANEIIKEMNSLSSSDRKLADNMRNKLNEKIKSTGNTSDVSTSDSKNKVSIIKPENVKLNMDVFVRSFGQNGIVISNVSKSNEVQVQIGAIKTSVKLKDLELPKTTSTPKKPKVQTSGYGGLNKSKTVKSEINVIGLNVEEALFVVDKFLDDCSLAKLQTARIVHGKGTGKLKNGIHQFLKTNSHVDSYRLGTYGEGEAGVTVVTLK